MFFDFKNLVFFFQEQRSQWPAPVRLLWLRGGAVSYTRAWRLSTGRAGWPAGRADTGQPGAQPEAVWLNARSPAAGTAESWTLCGVLCRGWGQSDASEEGHPAGRRLCSTWPGTGRGNGPGGHVLPFLSGPGRPLQGPADVLLGQVLDTASRCPLSLVPSCAFLLLWLPNRSWGGLGTPRGGTPTHPPSPTGRAVSVLRHWGFERHAGSVK